MFIICIGVTGFAVIFLIHICVLRCVRVSVLFICFALHVSWKIKAIKVNSLKAVLISELAEQAVL